MTMLLDSNVLVALAVGDHVHHQAATRWWAASAEPFATCPITQGALVRLLIREGLGSREAGRVLSLLVNHDRHTFWPDAMGYDVVDLTDVLGHGQVTDTYLAALARFHQGRLATFDRQLAGEHSDVVTLVPLP
jgi:toxin-antitoxin system PIN domain toxin